MWHVGTCLLELTSKYVHAMHVDIMMYYINCRILGWIFIYVWSLTLQLHAFVSPGRTLYHYVWCPTLQLHESNHHVGCRVSHSSLVRVETLAFIKNKK